MMSLSVDTRALLGLSSSLSSELFCDPGESIMLLIESDSGVYCSMVLSRFILDIPHESLSKKYFLSFFICLHQKKDTDYIDGLKNNLELLTDLSSITHDALNSLATSTATTFGEGQGCTSMQNLITRCLGKLARTLTNSGIQKLMIGQTSSDPF
ncbi:unnamed protein product [Camellia sinensis]